MPRNPLTPVRPVKPHLVRREKTLDVAELLLDLTARWMVKHPALADRIERAREIVRGGGVRREGGEWLVPSSRGGYQVVTVEEGKGRCSCEDHQHRGGRCAHILACGLLFRVAQAVEKAMVGEEKKESHPKTPKPSKGLEAVCRAAEERNRVLVSRLPVAP